MADIFREVEEDLRRDRLEQIWKRYGVLLVAAAAAILIATVGYELYRNWQQNQAEERTAKLLAAQQIARQDAGKPEDVQAKARTEAADALGAFASQAGTSGQAVLARFYEAGLRARQGDKDAAVRIYTGIAAQSGVEPALRDLATLLAVLHQVDTGDPAQLQSQLAALTGDASPWRFTARELSAALALRAGDREKARGLYAQLADDPATPSGLRTRAAELAAFYAEPR
jgi:hypothetical protein